MAESNDHIERWKNEVLSPLGDILKTFAEELHSQPLANFYTVVNELGKKATHDFLAIVEVRSLDDLGSKKILEFCTLLVSGLNSVLPLDYPFIVTLVLANQGSLIRVGAMNRRAIPGSHEIASNNLVPIISLDALKNLDRVKALHFQPTGVQHLNDPYDLEKKFQT